MTTTAGQHILNTALFEALFANDIRELGAAIAAAKQTLLANGDAYFEQVSATFLLFGDPAMSLKIPLPRMPSGLAAQRHADGKVRISWHAALDANGNAVAGYNIYRASAPGGPYSRINTALVTAAEYVDSPEGVGIEAAGSYYAVSSVDSAGDESAISLGISPATVPAAVTGGGAGGGCFVGTVNGSIPAGLFWILAIFTIAVVAVHWRTAHRLRNAE